MMMSVSVLVLEEFVSYGSGPLIVEPNSLRVRAFLINLRQGDCCARWQKTVLGKHMAKKMSRQCRANTTSIYL